MGANNYTTILENNEPCHCRSFFRFFLTRAFNMTDNMLMDRIFAVFPAQELHSKRAVWWLLVWDTNAIDPDLSVAGLVVLFMGSLSEQSNFCFNVYDLSGYGFITHEHVGLLLRTCMVGAHQSVCIRHNQFSSTYVERYLHCLKASISFFNFLGFSHSHH